MLEVKASTGKTEGQYLSQRGAQPKIPEFENTGLHVKTFNSGANRQRREGSSLGGATNGRAI